MTRTLNIVANGQPFSAYAGDLVLDAALRQGIDLPHDCRAGQCGTCLIRIVQGQFLGGETPRKGVVHACQARVFSDAQIKFDKLPQPRTVSGVLARIETLAPDIRGLTIKLSEASRHRPGQYCRFKFKGFPARCFSPTSPFAGHDHKRTLRLHVKVVRGGRVSSKLGTEIQAGHKIRVEGPFGSAFLRRGSGRRLVLVASGTGFAPIWAIAEASLRSAPNRPLLLIAGARRLTSLYMLPAFHRLSRYPAAKIIATTQEPQSVSPTIRRGTPIEHLPALAASDLVYAAGAPALVDAVAHAASRAGAEFYADPFVSGSGQEEPWLVRCQAGVVAVRSRLAAWFAQDSEEDPWGYDADADPFAVSNARLSAESFRREAGGAVSGQASQWRA
ncbi:MAG TPA: 2Fe-2S iron-sulfur cluster binding domain-containing protein [Hyphomicrobiaceae bacterium]|nr:2Fe-2S iron-sulfur cluster binding domain-containing protein [Hyphomicrobiaceae bacterium]